MNVPRHYHQKSNPPPPPNELYHARLVNFNNNQKPSPTTLPTDSSSHIYDELASATSAAPTTKSGDYCTAYDDDEDDFDTDIYSYGECSRFSAGTTRNERLLYKLIMNGGDVDMTSLDPVRRKSQKKQPPPPEVKPSQCFSSSSTSSGLSCSSSSVLSQTAVKSSPPPSQPPQVVNILSSSSSSSSSSSHLGNSASMSSLLLKTAASSPTNTASQADTTPPPNCNRNVPYALISAQLSKKSDDYRIDLVKVDYLLGFDINEGGRHF